jgi:hypothetical protein
MHKSLIEQMSNIVKVANIDEPDRRTEDEFEKENGKDPKRYAATGTLECPLMDISANVTLVNDVITTSAHAFIDPKSCKQHTSFTQCKFVLKNGDERQELELESMVDMGYKCPPPLPDPRRDWAVLKLKKPAKGVTPYSVAANAHVGPNTKLTAVQAQTFDFWKMKNGTKYFPKSIGNCGGPKKVYFQGTEEAYFSSTCDTGLGGSGGAFLDDSGPAPVLLGIVKGGNETDKQVELAIKKGRPNSGAYKESSWASYAVAVRGKFLQAILTAANGEEKGN